MRLFSILILFIFALSTPAALAEDIKSQTIDLGGYKAHFLTKGKSQTDKPTIVMFHGAGNIALVWAGVMEGLPDTITQVAIEELGVGKSDFGQINGTQRQKAFDAHRTLKLAGFQGPYIVVGQSLGGLTALEFTRQFGEEVSGVVLVDSSHPNMILRRRQKDGSFKKTIMRTLSNGNPIPPISNAPVSKDREVKVYPPQPRDVSDHLPNVPTKYHEDYTEGYKFEMRIPKGYKSHFTNELASMHQNWDDYKMGDTPLIIITAGQKELKGDDTFSHDYLMTHQNDKLDSFKSLSTAASVFVAYSTGHSIHMEAPFVVKNAILKTIEHSSPPS